MVNIDYACVSFKYNFSDGIKGTA